MRTLLIGRREGNVADVWLKRHMGPSDPRLMFHPTPDEMDMTREISIRIYIDRHGPFDEVVYCAGLNRLSWINDLRREDVEQGYAVNVFGLIDIVSSHMCYYGNAPKRVVAIVSDSSRTPMRGSLVYSSSKAALVGVLKNMARELAPHTTVVGVSPGIIEDTPMTNYIDDTVPGFRGWDPEKAREYEKSMIPMQRRATKKEVADCIDFALEGPSYLSGSIIDIAGGR